MALPTFRQWPRITCNNYQTFPSPPERLARETTVILGKSLDEIVQKYILSIREADGIVNTPIVMAGAQGIIKNIDRTMLAEYGGPAQLTRGWVNSILKRMNYTRRAGTTQAKITPQDFEEHRVNFL